MNRIQRISQDLLDQKLKLQMGIDPRVEIAHDKLQQMWIQVQRERNLEQTQDLQDKQLRDRAA